MGRGAAPLRYAAPRLGCCWAGALRSLSRCWADRRGATGATNTRERQRQRVALRSPRCPTSLLASMTGAGSNSNKWRGALRICTAGPASCWSRQRVAHRSPGRLPFLGCVAGRPVVNGNKWRPALREALSRARRRRPARLPRQQVAFRSPGGHREQAGARSPSGSLGRVGSGALG